MRAATFLSRLGKRFVAMRIRRPLRVRIPAVVCLPGEQAVGYTQGDMRVFGIDCGTEITGYGVVETDERGRNSRLVCKAFGAIRMAKQMSLPERLKQVSEELNQALEVWHPDVVAVEEVFYSVNAKSALKLGQVRGVALLSVARMGLPLAEYAPLKIKSSVVGYGLAGKEQVQFMVRRLLENENAFDSPDAADALAIAICHIHTAQTLEAQGARR